MGDDLMQRPRQLGGELRAVGVEQAARLRLVGGHGLLEAAPGRVVGRLADRLAQRFVEQRFVERVDREWTGPWELDPDAGGT
ncbi:MAG TPA: hypothetical protein VN853_02420, partial [Polyangia bacterium]|nr:hypothetical protein [Polyangia bacterium]